ncbi:movement protein [Sesamum angolense]|uniref:Movement protein n=1 Tax=Sesamum angolense TaxID=2727404 RepID=A0AAE1W7G6_9LAMI|nr:movement protein [Sesamum angolense]
MKRLRGTIKRTPLCCDNNDFPIIIGESGEPRKRRKQSNDSYSRNFKRTPFRRRSWWSKTKARTYKSGQRSGPTRAPSQGSRRTDTRSTGRTPMRRTFRRAHTRVNESFKDCNCWTCGARGHIAPDCPQKCGEIRKFEATNDILDAVYYGELVPIYQFEDLPSDESVYEEEIETNPMDLQPSQNNHSEGDRLQTSESLSGFFSRMTVSNKTMERIMRQDSNLSPYDGFRIRGIGKVLNQIELTQRKHHIIYKVSSGEFAIPMEFTGNVMKMQLIPKEEILEELSRLREEIAVTMKWIHIGTIEVVIKATFKEGIDSEIHLSIMDKRINNLRDGCLGTMIGNLYAGKLMFDIHPRIAYNLADQDFSRVLTLHQDFKRNDLMKECNRPYSITYRIAYALSNTHHSDLFLRKEYIKIPIIFKEFAKQPVVGRYEGMLEIAGHEILVAGVAGRENGSMTLGLSFLEDHKPWGRKGMVLRREKAFNRIMPINFRSKRGEKFGKSSFSFRQQGLIESESFYKESEEEIENLKEALEELKTMDISEESNFLENVKRLIQRNFSENLWHGGIGIRSKLLLRLKKNANMSPVNAPQIFQRKMDNLFKDYFEFMFVYIDDILIASKNMKEHMKHLEIFSDACYKEGLVLSEKKATTAVNKIEFLGILIDETGIELQEHIVEKIRNFPDILKDKKHLQSFLGVVCNNLPKLAIPQDEDELVVYTDANDYRWAAVLMKKTTTGEEPCRYTGGLFTEQQARMWHINEKEFFAVWKAFKK